MQRSIFVLTDISSLTPGVREPDDGQSLIRLLAHASEFDIRGLAATSNMGHGHVARPELIHQVIDAYAKVQANLRLHDARYPDADDLRARVYEGNPVAGPDVPVFDCIGPGRDTTASNALIAAVDALDAEDRDWEQKYQRLHPFPAPLWVLAWGGTCDLAQALWRVRHERKPESVNRFQAFLRVHAIYDQDSTAAWIKAEFPALFYLTHRHAVRGMYRGGDTSLVSPQWVRENLHGHGPLGDLYPVYDGGDVFSDRLGPARGVKEGDTPTFLRLLPFLPVSREVASQPTWGGRFRFHTATRWEDVGPLPTDAPDDPAPGMSAIYQFRPAYQAEFTTRMDWCIFPPGQVSLPPIIETDINAAGWGRADASPSVSPDGSSLRFHWQVLKDHPRYPLLLEDADTPRPTVTAPGSPYGFDGELLLSVTTSGTIPLTRYRIVQVYHSPWATR